MRHALRSELAKRLAYILQFSSTDMADPSDIYFCYRLLLGRQPDAQGWQHWSHLVDSGVTRETLVDDFLSSAEFKKKQKVPSCTRTDQEGFVMYVDATDQAVGSHIVHYGQYEPHVTSFLKKELKPYSTFVDVGANMGWFTLLAATTLQAEKVIAVEPSHSNVQLLYHSIVANQLQNVTIYPYAATDKETVLRFRSMGSNASVSQVNEVDSASTYVRGVKLDSLLKDEKSIDVVKVDVEGHEPLTLKGMQDVIVRHRPVILTEFHPQLIRLLSNVEPGDYLRAITDLGYQLSVIEGDGSEIAFADETGILRYWKELNKKLGNADMLHLDLVAHPT